MIEIIATAIAALASGYVMGRKDTRAELSADARRWRVIDQLRRSSETARVTIWNDDKAGRSNVSLVSGRLVDEFRAASVDIALDQALNAVERHDR